MDLSPCRLLKGGVGPIGVSFPEPQADSESHLTSKAVCLMMVALQWMCTLTMGGEVVMDPQAVSAPLPSHTSRGCSSAGTSSSKAPWTCRICTLADNPHIALRVAAYDCHRSSTSAAASWSLSSNVWRQRGHPRPKARIPESGGQVGRQHRQISGADGA